jgi:ferredoxin
MPKKYVIHTKPTPHRFKAITKSGIIAWEEGCLKCAVCVKKRCVYKVYENRAIDARQMMDSIDNQCMNCLRCVQGCPKELIHKSANPEYKSLGDNHYTPDIIEKLWYQAATGKIPVSGGGYPGPFSGQNFDAMWTDMSEIVRPTRDGIHGREYISTAVDLGGNLKNLHFHANGDLLSDIPQLVDIPLPIMMRVPAFGAISDETIKGWAMAARRLGTFLFLPQQRVGRRVDRALPFLVPEVTGKPRTGKPRTGKPRKWPKGGLRTRLVEMASEGEWKETFDAVKKAQPSSLLAVNLPLVEGVEKTVLPLLESGVSLIHLEASYDGKGYDKENVYLRDGIRRVHRTMVEEGVRDRVTLLASGGIAMAEHVAKAILCGADAVVIDFPILIALECRMCRRCTKGLPCPVEIDKAASSWVASRTVNFMGAWHNQLLEVMGAMGIRDARRLRGEVGRAMFFEDMDEATFGSLSEVKEGFEIE